MNIKNAARWLVLLGLTLALAAAALAQTGGASAPLGVGYDLSWWTVDGGGATSGGGGYTLSGAAGQPDAGTLTGGGYTLAGGFWGGAGGTARLQYTIELPLVQR